MGARPGDTPAHVRFTGDDMPSSEELSVLVMDQPTNTATTAADAGPPSPARERWLDKLTRAEIQELITHRDAMSWLSIAINWGTIFGSMALVAAWPNALTIGARTAADRHAPARYGDPDARRGPPRAVLEPHAQRLGRQLAVRVPRLDWTSSPTGRTT
ncbi:MAG: hypothetical protein U1F09_16295 [Steroidobacteraceae bacterium]